ncbi:MAG TPA: HIT family protein [Aggregatilineales bacterium]|nr:HIT family protein [Aggregatilineales bacterium]
MTECKACQRITRRDEDTVPLWDCIYRARACDVVHCDSTSILGWLIIIPRRHLAAIDEMTEAEAIEVGRLIRAVSIALKHVLDCEKTYVSQFAEAPGYQHVHFHVIPRAKDLPEDRKGANIFKNLGLPPEKRLDETTMNDISARILSHLDKADSF